MLNKKKLFWVVIIAILISQFFIFFATPPSEIIKDLKSYLSDSIFFFFFCILVIYYFKQIHKKYLNTINFEKEFQKRIFYQIVLGLILPIFFIYFSVYFYIKKFTSFLWKDITFNYVEFPVSIIVLLILNIYFVGYYFFNENKKNILTLIALESELFQIQSLQSNVITAENSKVNKVKTSIIIVSSGKKNIPIQTAEIAYIFKSEEFTYLQTFDNNQYMMSYSLEELMSLLEEKDFFRANRQIIISIKSMLSFSNEENGKISLELSPKYKGDAIVSQKKASEFRKWLDR